METSLNIFIKILFALGSIIGGLWALTKYVIERGLVPAAELDLDCNVVGHKGKSKIIEMTVRIINKGSSILVAKDICLRLKTIEKDSTLSLYSDAQKYGRLRFPNSLSRAFAEDEEAHKKETFELVPHDTFVQPGVDQKYSFVTRISEDSEFLHAHAEFQYAQKPTRFQKRILWISRRMGLIQYTLHHIYEPHTIQKVFNVQE